MRNGLRELGTAAPILIARSTTCGGVARNRTAIREAQTRLAQNHGDLRLGPDTDTLGAEYRHDKCHFSGAGLDRAAAMWGDALAAEFGKRAGEARP
jgi:hypothetical protein